MSVARLAVVVVSVLVLSSCGGTEDAEDGIPINREMSHVHGVGTNPADGATFVATHSGVFRIEDGAEPVRVADRQQDTMGFTVAGPDRFLGSGHPDLADESLPTHLGLIESTDAAETWDLMSLSGEADLHALDTGAGGIVAFDALSGRLLSSPDGQAWTEVAEGPVLDLAADPVREGWTVVTTPDGELVEFDPDGQSRVLEEAPVVGFVDWPREDLMVAAGPDGVLHRSEDGGETWTSSGEELGAPQAIDVSDEAWLVATQEKVLRSTDEGQTWQTLVRLS